MQAILRSTPLTIGLGLVLAAFQPLGAVPPSQKELDATLRKLEKDIAAVRGLEFKTPVVAKIIPRPAGTDKKLQGYYSIKDKALFIYDDLSGAYERGVLIHEMVHALQDQHFGLKELHQTGFDTDAELARAALIEGDATFTMIELLKKDQPRVAAMLDAPLDKAKNLRNAFLYVQGARYVKALKERGGWAAVNSVYRFPPRSTVSILHAEAGVSSINLGPGKTRGAFALLEMFAGNPETQAFALRAARSWRGDRQVEDGPAKAWVIACTNRDDALHLQTALANLQLAQKPDLKNLLVEEGVNVWQTAQGGVHAVRARGDRVFVLDAPDQKAAGALLDRLEGAPVVVIHARKDKRTLSFGELSDRLLEADLVCIGESHDSELDHRVQLQIIKGLFARDERLGVGLEMFQRPFQDALDRYLRGDLAEGDMLTATEYSKRWGYDWSLYRPIAEFCRKNGVPLAALNAGRELTGRISKVGFAGLNEDEKKQLGKVDFHVKEHRAHWYEQLAQMHGKAKVSEEQKERSYQVMTVWDDYMADSAARFQQERRLRRMVVLAGSGHIDRGFGIPDRAARRTGGRAVTVRIEVGEDAAQAGEAVTDYTIVVH
jgi:uncharacterized iron-regulated protein